MRSPNAFKFDLLLGIVLATTFSLTMWSCSLITIEQRVVLVFFNYLFGTLIFPLDGVLKTKIALLATGNTLGLFWNILLSELLVKSVSNALSEKLFVFTQPIFNLMWVVPFWSVSMSLMSRIKLQKPEA